MPRLNTLEKALVFYMPGAEHAVGEAYVSSPEATLWEAYEILL